jgi:MFS family permease
VAALSARLREARRDFAAVFANPNLRRLELAWASSIVATWAYNVTLIVFAYDHGGAGAVGLVGALRWVPAAVVTPFAGLWADRYDRRLLMVGSDLGRAALIGISAAAVLAGSPAAFVYVLAALVGIAATPFRPAEAAYTPSLARTPEELGAANVVAAAIESIGIFAGPAIGGLLLAWTSVGTTLIVTGVAIGVSALLLVGIRVSGIPSEAASGGSVVDELLAGARAIWRDRRVGLLVALFGAQTFVDGVLGVLIAVLALSYLDAGASMVGWLNAATGFGGIAGAVVAGVLVGRGRLAGDFGLGVLLFGLPLALVAVSHSTVAALLLLGVVGVGNTLTDVSGVTLLQRAAPEAVVGRVFGVLETLLLLTVALGAALAPALVAAFGTRGALVVAGVLLPVLVLTTGRTLRRIDATATAPVAEVELLRRVPFFASLPEASIERLARRADEESAAVDTWLVRQGEPGESFYVVRSGAAEVLVDGKATATLGPGDYFGEIALLRDVPRTAAVRARADTDLLVLTRDDFLTAVVGYAPSLASAEVVVARRLGGRI